MDRRLPSSMGYVCQYTQLRILLIVTINNNYEPLMWTKKCCGQTLHRLSTFHCSKPKFWKKEQPVYLLILRFLKNSLIFSYSICWSLYPPPTPPRFSHLKAYPSSCSLSLLKNKRKEKQQNQSRKLWSIYAEETLMISKLLI